jgi:hypothetical protein
MSKTVTLQGFFINLDKFDRMTLQFLDDYEDEKNSSSTTGLISDNTILSYTQRKNNISFTKQYLIKKDKSLLGYSPISADKEYFYVKCRNIKIGYINDIPHPILDLKQHKVLITAEVKTYKFTKTGESHQGWYINLKKIELLEM